MYGHDTNQLPVDITGTLVPLPISPSSPPPVGFVHGAPATFNGGFVQRDYLVLPWVMAIMRWDAVNSGPDHINSLAHSSSTPFVLPFRSTRNRFTPGVQFLIHANIKASFEYQFRPQQTVTVITNPITGLPVAIQPFRTNTAVAGLGWIFLEYRRDENMKLKKLFTLIVPNILAVPPCHAGSIQRNVP